MARGKQSTATTVSLFPFLAVLVCVMGSLIFLLLATTKRMHDLAIADAEARHVARHSPNPLPMVPDLPRVDVPLPRLGDSTEPATVPSFPNSPPELTDEARQKTAELEAELAKLLQRRSELQTALRRQQALQSAAQGKIEALQASVDESQTKLRGVLAQIDSFQEDLSAEQDLAALEEQIAELRQQLRKLQNRQSAGQTKFAVIPFDVRNGTTRRPILIECTDHGLRFLPEDVVITPNDLEGFTEQYNPLLAGARALMSHWTSWNMRQPNPEDKPEPYVLLIVRPNGTVGYYVAMRMLSSLKQPHGYELIDDSIPLQPPPLDPEAQRVCREAVQRQLAERSGVAQEARDAFRSGGGFENPTAAGSGKKARGPSSNKFEVSDVMPPSPETGSERSWENIERFEGRRHSQRSASSGESPTQSGGGERPPQTAGSSRPAGQAGSAAPVAAQDQPRSQPADQPRELPDSVTGENTGVARMQRSSSSRLQPVPPDEQADGDAELPPSQTGDRPRPVPQNSRSVGQRGPQGQPSGMTRQPGGKRHRHEDSGDIQSHLSQLGRRHWGDSEPHASIGIEQDVSIRVDAEQMVVSEHHVVRYQPGEQSLELFLRLMEAVDAEANTWGKPRPGFYWTPRLRFVISPGGNQAFERIDPLTIRSGLSTTREFTLEGVSATKSEKQP